MSTQTNLEPSFLDRLGDGFNKFIEGSVGFISRLMGGSANDRMVKSVGYIRPKGAEQHSVLPGSILDKVNRLEPEMQAVDPAARIVFEPKSSWPGLETPAALDVVGLAKTLAGRNAYSKVAFGTEAGLFAAAGIPTVVIGPGSIDQAHKADEYVAVAQLEACSAFLDRLTAHSCA